MLHRNEIAVVRLEVITVTVGEVMADDQWLRFRGDLKARPAGGVAGGREFALGEVDLEARTGAEAKLEFGLTRAPKDSEGVTLNQFIVEVLRGDGRLDLLLEGQAEGGRGHFKLAVELDLQMGYKN